MSPLRQISRQKSMGSTVPHFSWGFSALGLLVFLTIKALICMVNRESSLASPLAPTINKVSLWDHFLSCIYTSWIGDNSLRSWHSDQLFSPDSSALNTTLLLTWAQEAAWAYRQSLGAAFSHTDNLPPLPWDCRIRNRGVAGSQMSSHICLCDTSIFDLCLLLFCTEIIQGLSMLTKHTYTFITFPIPLTPKSHGTRPGILTM